MKLTKQQLKQIIKEELETILNEKMVSPHSIEFFNDPEGIARQIIQAFTGNQRKDHFEGADTDDQWLTQSIQDAAREAALEETWAEKRRREVEQKYADMGFVSAEQDAEDQAYKNLLQHMMLSGELEDQ